LWNYALHTNQCLRVKSRTCHVGLRKEKFAVSFQVDLLVLEVDDRFEPAVAVLQV